MKSFMQHEEKKIEKGTSMDIMLWLLDLGNVVDPVHHSQ
jgi:hypothetical protein